MTGKRATVRPRKPSVQLKRDRCFGVVAGEGGLDLLAEIYDLYKNVLQSVPLPTMEGMQLLLGWMAQTDARAKAAKAEQFIDAGPLKEGWRIQRDTPGYGPRRTAEELRRDLAVAKRYSEQ